MDLYENRTFRYNFRVVLGIGLGLLFYFSDIESLGEQLPNRFGAIIITLVPLLLSSLLLPLVFLFISKKGIRLRLSKTDVLYGLIIAFCALSGLNMLYYSLPLYALLIVGVFRQVQRFRQQKETYNYGKSIIGLLKTAFFVFIFFIIFIIHTSFIIPAADAMGIESMTGLAESFVSQMPKILIGLLVTLTYVLFIEFAIPIFFLLYRHFKRKNY